VNSFLSRHVQHKASTVESLQKERWPKKVYSEDDRNKKTRGRGVDDTLGRAKKGAVGWISEEGRT